MKPGFLWPIFAASTASATPALQVEGQIRRHGRFGSQAPAGAVWRNVVLDHLSRVDADAGELEAAILPILEHAKRVKTSCAELCAEKSEFLNLTKTAI